MEQLKQQKHQRVFLVNEYELLKFIESMEVKSNEE